MAVSVSCNTWFSLWKSEKLILLNMAQMFQASTTRIRIFFKPHTVYFFSHESAFCAHETSESAYWPAWNLCKKICGFKKLYIRIGVDGVSVWDKPLPVVWQWIRHFVGWSLCLGGEDPLMTRTICSSIPAGLVQGRGQCRAPPPPSPWFCLRGGGYTG